MSALINNALAHLVEMEETPEQVYCYELVFL